MKQLFSGGRRLYLSRPHTQLHSSSLPLFHRFLSSDSDSNSTPKPHSVPVQPVSYAVKPKDDQKPINEEETISQQNVQSEEQSSQEARSSWTREDMRYLKNMPSISPVSYATRVAPLPVDRVRVDGGEKAPGEMNVEMEKERRKIEAQRLGRSTGFASALEEKTVVPFPRLIKPEKKEKRPLFDLNDAIRQVKANSKATFDETVEAHVRLGIPKARSDLIVRGALTLPHGEKKVIRVAVFAEGSDAEEAQTAGADIVGGVELIEEIASTGKIDFDKCFTTPKLYPRVAKLARILNRHGLMPDRKQGTVVTNVTRAVKDAKKNQIMFKMDKTSIVHVGLGKVSFSEESLRENVGALMNALLLAKPAGLKKTSKYAGYVNSFHICSTMGPGLPVSIQSVSKAVDQFSRVQPKS